MCFSFYDGVRICCLCAVVSEAIWLRQFSQSLSVTTRANEVVVIYCDNTAAIAYAKDPKYHGKIKYIEN